MATCTPPGLDDHLNLDLSVADLRAPSIPTKRYRDVLTSHSSKRKGTPDSIHIYSRPAIYPLGYWTAPRGGKVRRMETAHNTRIEIHQSTLLNLAMADPSNPGATGTESDLWILPDFEDWEVETPSTAALAEDAPFFTAPSSPQIDERKESRSPSLVERAVSSNRERLRRRLEGDGWDFVGGRYSKDSRDIPHETYHSEEESVDEEFDVVVLPRSTAMT